MYEMFAKPSLLTRIAVGKLVGLVFGLIAFFIAPLLIPDVAMTLRFGILFWYITIGAIIGVFGVVTWHPILKLPFPWWFRAPFLGGWMNFLLVLIAYNHIAELMYAIFGEHGYLRSPFWIVVEGAIIGLIIGGCATWFGGEGRETVKDMGG